MILTRTFRPETDRSILSRISDWIANELEVIRRRRALQALLDLDDVMLDDIGITRADLDWALSLPLSVNAALELRKVARSRRERESRGMRRY